MGGSYNTHADVRPAYENVIAGSEIKILGLHRRKWQIVIKFIISK
jgi:hypothetical protein